MPTHAQSSARHAPSPVPDPPGATLTSADIARIRQDFGRVANDPEGLAALFYARLFEIEPELRGLFRGDLTAQGRKLTAALAVVVHSLDRLDGILATIQALGARHAGYGVEERHYALVGEALLDTLRTCLGASFDTDAVRAWTIAYGILASAMIGAQGGPYDA